ncbi:hypothetical protein KKD03_05005 [Patescibacteria group bacterium]|nr:hypothetical protein [Patescibacteria group bacterium]
MSSRTTERLTQTQELLQRKGWKPSIFLELTILNAQKLEEEGLDAPQAKIVAYNQAINQLKNDGRLFGESPQNRATRFELAHAVCLIEDGKEDIIAIEINGIQPALLTDEKAEAIIFSSKDQYQKLIDDLSSRESSFGSYSERSNARIRLIVARDLLP